MGEEVNLKQMAKTLNYITEHGLTEYELLEKKAEEASSIFDKFQSEIKDCERRMEEIAELRTQIINYVKTREIFAEYRKSGYAKKFLEEHESEILIHRNAKKTLIVSG